MIYSWDNFWRILKQKFGHDNDDDFIKVFIFFNNLFGLFPSINLTFIEDFQKMLNENPEIKIKLLESRVIINFVREFPGEKFHYENG